MIVDHPELVAQHVTSAVSMLSSYFIRRLERPLERPASWEVESILVACAVGIDKFLNTPQVLSNEELSRELDDIVTASWPAITFWIENTNQAIYPRLEPEMKKQYQRCLLHVCSIIAACSDVVVTLGVPAMPSIFPLLAELWIKRDFLWITERLGVCNAFYIAGRGNKNVTHPTMFFAEHGLDPPGAVDLALLRLMEFKDKKCLAHAYAREFTDCILIFVGLSTSPNPAFCDAIAERRIFATATSLCRKMRRVAAKVHDIWNVASEHMYIYALTSILVGINAEMRSVYETRYLAQALRKGLLELVLAAMMAYSSGEIAGGYGCGFDILKRFISIELPPLLADRLVAAGAAYGLSYLSSTFIKKLSSYEFWPEWLELGRLMLDRFAIHRLLRSLSRYDIYDTHACGNVRT